MAKARTGKINSKRTNAENIIGYVIDLTRSVDYQAGSVVSRALISKKAGTVTVFAFGEGQGLSEHTAAFDALVYILDGEAKINIAGRNFRLKTGQMIIMPAHKPHSLKAVKRFKMLLVMVKK